jgi:hypothetical protein
MPGTPSGKSIVLKIGGRGGGGYSMGYNDPLRMEKEAEQGLFAEAKERRAAQQEDIAMRAAERRDRYEQRQLQRQDDIDSALDLIGTKLSNPASMHFQDKYEEIMGDPLVHRAMAGHEGRAAVMGMLKDLHDSHQNYLEGWQKLTSNYGADMSDLALNKTTGEVDWKNSLPMLNQKLQQKHEADVIKKAQGRAEAFKQQAVAEEISPEGEVTGYKVVKGLKPKVMTLDPSIQDHLIIAQSYFDKAGGDKKKARELAKKDGYTF